MLWWYFEDHDVRRMTMQAKKMMRMMMMMDVSPSPYPMVVVC